MFPATQRMSECICGAVVLVLGFAGIAKLFDLYAFRLSLDSWKFIPGAARPFLAATLSTLESALALLWILNVARPRVERTVILLLAAMGSVSLYHVVFSKPPTCNCFGVFSAYASFLEDGRLLVWKAWGMATILLACAPWRRAPVKAHVAQSEGLALAPERTRGFTLVELLIVIAIIALLIITLFPSLRQARGAALRMRTVANLKSHAGVLAVYAMDWADAFPSFFPPSAGPFQLVGGGALVNVPQYFMATEQWPTGLTDSYYGLPPTHPVFFDEEFRDVPNGAPALALSCTLFARPDFWTSRRLSGTAQYGTTYQFQVLTPAQKTILFSELRLTGRPLGPSGGMASSQPLPVPMAFADSHARTLYANQILSGVSDGEGGSPGGYHTFDVLLGAHTLGGVSGFDTH